MNREIKFRIWTKFSHEDQRYKPNIMWLWEEILENFDMEINHYKTVLFLALGDDHENSFEVMQFTGLKDKNGKEIYEGDIVRLLQGNRAKGNTLSPVVWGESGQWELGHSVDLVTCGGHDLPFFVSQKQWNDISIEVMGNIYENPELLK